MALAWQGHVSNGGEALGPMVAGVLRHGEGCDGYEKEEGGAAMLMRSPTRREVDGGDRRRGRSGGEVLSSTKWALRGSSGDVAVRTRFAG